MASAPPGGDPGSPIITGPDPITGGGAGGGGIGVGNVIQGGAAGLGAISNSKARGDYNNRYANAIAMVNQYAAKYGDWQKGVEALFGTPDAPGPAGSLLFGPRTTTSSSR